MQLFIFNDSTGKQRADFYQDQLSETILWQGESWLAFEADTGLTQAQLGGFKLTKGKLAFSQALKDAHDNPPPPPLSVEEKRLILIDQFKTLPIETRVKFQAVAVNVDTSLKLGDVELALFNLEQAKLVEGADVALLQGMIDLINS